MADQVPTDKRGFVVIVKDGTEAKVLPESLRVYTDRGWSVKDTTDKPARTSRTKKEES